MARPKLSRDRIEELVDHQLSSALFALLDARRPYAIEAMRIHCHAYALACYNMARATVALLCDPDEHEELYDTWPMGDEWIKAVEAALAGDEAGATFLGRRARHELELKELHNAS